MAPLIFSMASVSFSIAPMTLFSIKKSLKPHMIFHSSSSLGARGLSLESFSLSTMHSSSSPAQVPIQASSDGQIITHPITEYPPSIWGDLFLDYKYNQMALDAISHKIEELKDQVRQMFVAYATNLPLPVMEFIDTLQRLGVAYHFETEIEEVLEKVFSDNYLYNIDHLYTTALGFRLLRQHGYHVSCDLFCKYKDKSGNFRASLADDIPSMLSLYEAAHLRVHREEILDEALTFTSSNLISKVNNLNAPMAKLVNHALRRPLHKNMPRLEALKFISIYEEKDEHNEILLEFATLDFNILQSLYQKGLSEISMWWRDMGLTIKLPFIRERVVENYFWALGTFFEPQYSLGRALLTKALVIVSALDDIYDDYGTLEELGLFTDAIKRWDISAINHLPDYMKVMFRVIMDFYNEIEDEMVKQGKLYVVDQAKELLKDVVEAEYVEQKWLVDGYIPTTEEYIENALVGGTFVLLSFISFFGMGDIVPKEAYDWVKNDVIPVRSFAVIGRLMDDIQTHEVEQKRGHGASAIECYMNQYNVSKEKAYDEIDKMVDQEWKNLNQGCLKPTVVPRPLLERVVNITRMIEVIYKYEDGYNNPHLALKDDISSLLIDPIPI